MSDPIQVGPGQPCLYCDGDYGLHEPTCIRPQPSIPPAPPARESEIDVPLYPSGTIRYRKDRDGWLVYEDEPDGDGGRCFRFRGSLVSHAYDPLWMVARFAEALDAFRRLHAELAEARLALHRSHVNEHRLLEHLDSLTAELRDRKHDYQSELRARLSAETRIASLTADRDRYQKALLKYAAHRVHCAAQYRKAPCTCGLDAALSPEQPSNE